MKVGVLALQGAFIEHVKVLNKLEIEVVLVRSAIDLENIDGLIIPGGESTAIGKLLEIFELKESLQSKLSEGLPVWGTCAGMILLAKKIEGSEINYLPVMDIEVTRNAYGRQLGSFSTHAEIEGIEKPFPMVFIRAPYVKQVGVNVKILSQVDGNIVAAREKNMLVTSFHPELTQDLRLHEYFIGIIKKCNEVSKKM